MKPENPLSDPPNGLPPRPPRPMKRLLAATLSLAMLLQGPLSMVHAAQGGGEGVLEFDTNPRGGGNPFQPDGPTGGGFQPGGQPMAAPNYLVAHVPGAANMPAPEWVKPGVRITVWMGSATYLGGGSMTTAVPDPNGDLVDSNGKRYRQSTAGASGSNGGAGAGFMAVDVIAVTPNAVAIDVRSYGGTGQYHQPQLMSLTSQIVNPGACEWWIHPELLAKVQPGGNALGQVLKGGWTTPNNQKYQAVVFKSQSSQSKGHMVYDAKTGITLGMSQLTTGTSSHTQYNPTTGETSPATSNNKTMSESYLVGMRQVQYPWSNSKLPAANLIPSHYRGEMGLEPNTYGVPGTPIAETVQVKRQGLGWIETAATRTMHGQKIPGLPRVTAVHQVGGYLMDPQALRTLRQGQAIDQDPITGNRIFVEYVGQANNGQTVVCIREETGGGAMRWAYDLRTGVLHSATMATFMPAGMGSSVVHLERTGR